jgi:ankyrin repeat protein
MPESPDFAALQKLIKKGDVVSLRRELDAGVSPNLSNQFSWTLLMLAATEGHTSIGDLLIARGADINRVNDFGETALSLAANAGDVPFIRALLANGVSIHCQPHGQSLRDWLTVSSGLSSKKIASILDLIEATGTRSEQ